MIRKLAIEKAIEGGWLQPAWHFDIEAVDASKNGHPASELEQIRNMALDRCVVLDRSFWVALGKGLGNRDEMRCDSPKCETVQCEYAGYKDPRRMYDQFCDLIWTEGDTGKWWDEILAAHIN